MKKLYKTTLIILLIFNFGCSKDFEIDESDTSGKLAGVWNVEKYEYEGVTTSIFQNDHDVTRFRGFGWNLNITMSFTESPNNYSLNGSFFVDHFITQDNGQELLYFGDLTTDEAGIWDRTGHQVTLEIEGNNIRCYISELTKDTMEFSINSHETETEADGTTTTTQLTRVYNLKRIN